jgi:hypothetical protein
MRTWILASLVVALGCGDDGSDDGGGSSGGSGSASTTGTTSADASSSGGGSGSAEGSAEGSSGAGSDSGSGGGSSGGGSSGGGSSGTGTETGSGGTFPCGDQLACTVDTQYCEEHVGPGKVPPSYGCVDVPPTCPAVPTCECLSMVTCGSICEAVVDGGLQVSCLKP